MATMDERLDQWLRDAHAMEEQAEQMLKAQASRIENYPQLSARIEQHLAETQSQKQRLEACMSRRGVSTSGVKDLAGKMTAMMQGVGGAMVSDEVVKGVLASYAFEHFEAGSYRILVSAAQAAGDGETARVCEQILREEEAMGSWIADHMSEVTQTYLTREEARMDEAKR